MSDTWTHVISHQTIFDPYLSAGSFAIKFLNSGVCRIGKEAFFLEIRYPLSVFRFEISTFSLSLWDSRQRRRAVPQLVYKIFLTINEWHTPKSVECLPPLLQLKHLLNQYFKHHCGVCKGCAPLAVHYFVCLKLPETFTGKFGGWEIQYATVSQ